MDSVQIKAEKALRQTKGKAMKKTILVIVIVLMLVCIIALSFRIYSVVAAAGAQASEEPAATEALPTETPASDTASASAESSSADAETLRGLMADFGDKIQAGSAGSSLKAAGQAVRLINWGIDTKMSGEEISKVVSEYISTMDGYKTEEYLAQIELLDSTYRQLLAPGQEEFLESAGCADSGYPWGSEPIPAVEAFFEAAGVRSAE